jgi:hypothetical protein
MKKTLATAILATLSLTAFSTETTLSVVHDQLIDRTGAKVSLAFEPVYSVKPVLSVTHIPGQYEKYAVGGEYSFAKLGKADFSLTGSAFRQVNYTVGSGYGLNYGLQATYPITKSLTGVVGVERTMTQTVLGRDGSTVSAGVSYNF